MVFDAIVAIFLLACCFFALGWFAKSYNFKLIIEKEDKKCKDTKVGSKRKNHKEFMELK